MANNNVASGLTPLNDNGTTFTGQGQMVSFAANDSNNIFAGDPVLATGLTDSFGVPIVTIATAGSGTVVLGSFLRPCNGPAGSGVTLTRDLPTYRQASILNYGMITDDPNTLFAIQEDSVGGAIAAAASGFQNADLVAGAGSTYSGQSGWMLDSSTVNTTNTLQIRIIGLVRGPDNALGNYAKWLVRLNLPQLWGTTGA